MWINAQYRILKRISPQSPACCTGSSYQGKSKLAILLGNEFLSKIAGKTIIDFGCGEGAEAVEMARVGAKRVIGLDMREDLLQIARQKAVIAGVQDTCVFASETHEHADIIVSMDCFEHFADPAGVLGIMSMI